jgi:hypothetical protein
VKPRHWNLRTMILGLVALGFVACQGNPGPTAVPEGARYDTTTINGVRLLLRPAGARLTPAAIVTEIIGADGGSISTDGGTLTIPAGALGVPELISMRGPEDNLWAYAFGPNGLQFEIPATLEIRLGELGIDPSQLKAAGASDLGNDWQVIDESMYDPERGAVVAPIQHFSQYALCID